MNAIMNSVVGSRMRSAHAAVRPAGQADMTFDTSGNVTDYGTGPTSKPMDTTGAAGGGSSAAMYGAIGGALGVAGSTIASIVNSGNQLQIAQLNSQTQRQIAQLQLQAQQAQQQGNMALAQQQAQQAQQLAAFQQSYLMGQPAQYTGLYIVGAVVALGIIGTFVVLGARARHNPTVRRFRDVGQGEEFRFESEKRFGPASGIARGPWIKTSNRTYRHVYDKNEVEHRVGSINVEVLVDEE